MKICVSILFLFICPILSFSQNFTEDVLVYHNDVLGVQRGMLDTVLFAQLENAHIKERSYNKTDGLHKMYSIELMSVKSTKFDVFSECENSNNCYVTKTVLRTPNFVTRRGIRVGSTFNEILLSYKNPKITTIDGGIVIVPMEGQNVAFVLEGISLPVKNEAYSLNDIPLKTKVSCIHVF